MEYDDAYSVPQDAIAVQVTSSLVEDRYVQLAPTYNGGPKLAEGANIPQTRTAVPAEIDQIYGALNQLSVALGPNGANKSGALSDLLNVSAANLGGNGDALGQSLQNLSQAARTLADGRNDLFGTVKNLQAFTDALAGSDTQVRHLNDVLAQVAGQLADERQSLADALHNLAGALDSVNGFIKDNAAAFHQDIVGLEQVTNLLVKDQAALNESLAIAPVALANLAHTYNPGSGTLDTRSSLSSLAQPQDLCGVLAEMGKLTNPSDPTTQICTQIATQLGTTLAGLVTLVTSNSSAGLPTVPGLP
jgi:phospholipid/cholesterol/gamma-HCH transport system substrate-binding protein